jgi:hypothetical protein
MPPLLLQAHNKLMTSFEKLAVYLDSFASSADNYDFACYLKEKLANLPGVDGHEEENNQADELAVAPTDKPHENLEGNMLEPAFKDLEQQNEFEAEKSQIKSAKTLLDVLKTL